MPKLELNDLGTLSLKLSQGYGYVMSGNCMCAHTVAGELYKKYPVFALIISTFCNPPELMTSQMIFGRHVIVFSRVVIES